MVRSLSHERVNEVGTAESSSDQRVNITTVRRPDLDVLADVREHVLMTHADKSQLAEIGVGGEILAAWSE